MKPQELCENTSMFWVGGVDMMDAQNSGGNELIEFNESGRASSSVPSLSLVSSHTRQRDFLSWRFRLWWRVFHSWEIFAMRRSCSSSTAFNSDSNLLDEWFRDFNERLTQGWPQWTHSAHLRWFSIVTQRRPREVQCSQRKRMMDFFLWISWASARQLQDLDCILDLGILMGDSEYTLTYIDSEN